MGSTASMGEVRVGISGWNYPAWRGQFYPVGLPQRDELQFAGSRFTSIEVNASFYRLQKPETFRRWAEQVPADFAFAVKGSRYITHMKRLGSDTALANFLASGVLALDTKLGPMLWQLPANLPFDDTVVRGFVARLPTTTGGAARVAANHDDRLAGRSWFAIDTSRPLRHAIEVRHESFRDERFFSILREHDVALVVADSAQQFPQFDVDTADFGYVRLHGAEELYASGYDDNALAAWARRIDRWRSKGRDAYVYFDNDARGHAPFDALSLLRILAGERS
jgi:uncharacterized protein YecE (DUF72 family)